MMRGAGAFALLPEVGRQLLLPVPLSEIVSDGLAALLVTVRLPFRIREVDVYRRAGRDCVSVLNVTHGLIGAGVLTRIVGVGRDDAGQIGGGKLESLIKVQDALVGIVADFD